MGEQFEKRVFQETAKTKELFPDIEFGQDCIWANLIEGVSGKISADPETLIEASIEVYVDQESEPAGGIVAVRNSAGYIAYSEEAVCNEEGGK